MTSQEQWKVSDSYSADGDVAVVGKNGEGAICYCVGAERALNALLIAAAPLMYEAIDEYFEAWNVRGDKREEMIDKAMKKMFEAITKATS